MAATRRGQGNDRIEYTVESAAVQAAIRVPLYRGIPPAGYDGHHAHFRFCLLHWTARNGCWEIREE